jgi:DNA-directed RNA polymerase alpha subunit
MNFKIEIELLNTNDNKINFDIQGDKILGLDKSIVNSLRRVLLTSIPSIAFRTEIQSSDIKVVNNDTPLHNEFLIHRISLIPLYIDPSSYEKQYLFYLNVESSDNPITSVTAKDFNIYPKKDDVDLGTDIDINNYDMDKPLSEKEKEKIFKPFKFQGSNEYCLISELKTTNSKNKKQKLELYGVPSISYAYEHAKWQAVSQCSYIFKHNEELFNNVIQEKAKVQNIQDFEKFKNSLMISEGERYFHRDNSTNPNWYEFTIESLHFKNSKNLFIESCQIMVNQFEILKNEIPNISTNEDSIVDIETNQENVYKLIFQGFDDTIGNVLQSFISRYMIEEGSAFSVCGYKRPHPLEEVIHLYLSFNPGNKISEGNQTQKIITLIQTIIESCDHLINLYSQIMNEAEKKL